MYHRIIAVDKESKTSHIRNKSS